MITAVGLDLGTTGIKSALLESDGRLGPAVRTAAPELTGDGLTRESDPSLYFERAARSLSRALVGLPRETPVGVASQRSTFLLWERSSGRPVTPLVSWQDRRAAAWCEARKETAPKITAMTGLPLSPHYAGPKLAHLFASNPSLLEGARSGRIFFGTAETWFIWNASRGSRHVTDLSMAARTLLADPESGSWSPELLDLFGVPRPCLPAITSTDGLRLPLAAGGVVTAAAADQAAALAAVTGDGTEGALINLGTGGFVLFPTTVRRVPPPGYLAGPAHRGGAGERLFALEGTINGIGPALAAGESLPFPEDDPTPGLFCLPETSGLGAPFWRPEIPQTFSVPPSTLSAVERNRAIREGVLFRVRQIVEDMEAAVGGRRLYLSGGIAADAFLPGGLATCLGRPLHLPVVKETTLLGAALLAAHALDADSSREIREATPSQGHYLREKYAPWRSWVKSTLVRP
jgi:glycerol kinase